MSVTETLKPLLLIMFRAYVLCLSMFTKLRTNFLRIFLRSVRYFILKVYVPFGMVVFVVSKGKRIQKAT